ncbi:type II toxin-antitoxin system prevent-host-death family antitoxin [Porticoccaceae bacterium]|nr:type II toxin-antitoxin system prevent-host-death family antitoxin [Porticoccaceae bacterium]
MEDEKVSIVKCRSIKIVSKLHSSKAPTLITENAPLSRDLGDIYDDELEQRRIRILKGIAKGECDIDEGRCFTHGEAKNKLNKWLE